MTEQESIGEEIRRLGLDLGAAQAWAERGTIDEWVHMFLTSGKGGQTNVAFAEALRQEQRWWRGPMKVSLSALSPAVGTDPGLEYVVAAADWHAWTGRLASGFTDLEALPPLIIEYRDGELSIRDGNTRYGAMQHLGWSHCWIVIWYNSQADFDAHDTAYQQLGNT